MWAWKHRARAPQLTQLTCKLHFHLHTPKYLLIAWPHGIHQPLAADCLSKESEGQLWKPSLIFGNYLDLQQISAIQDYSLVIYYTFLLPWSWLQHVQHHSAMSDLCLLPTFIPDRWFVIKILHMEVSLLTYFYKHFYILLFFPQVQMIFQNPFQYFQTQTNTLRRISKYI